MLILWKIAALMSNCSTFANSFKIAMELFHSSMLYLMFSCLEVLQEPLTVQLPLARFSVYFINRIRTVDSYPKGRYG